MPKNCNMAKDLMPLVIDQAASEESKNFVEQHMENCPECRGCYEGMQRQLVADRARADQEAERKLMEAAALELKKKRRRRSLKAVLIGTLVALVLTYCGALLFSRLAYTPAVYLEADRIEFSMYQLSDGDIYFRQTALNAGFYVEWHEKTETVDGKTVLSLQAKEPRLTLRRQESGNSCTGILGNIDEQGIDLIRIGKEGAWETVWEKGQSIPPASETLENYWAISEKITALFERAEDVDGKPGFTDEDWVEYEKLQAELSFWGRRLYEERYAESKME